MVTADLALPGADVPSGPAATGAPLVALLANGLPLSEHVMQSHGSPSCIPSIVRTSTVFSSHDDSELQQRLRHDHGTMRNSFRIASTVSLALHTKPGPTSRRASSSVWNH